MIKTRTLALLSASIALTGALFATTVSAANLNVPAPGTPAVAPAAADGTLGTAILSAAINGDGTIARGEGVSATGTSRLSAGVYEVGFVRNIVDCSYNLTAGESGVGAATPRIVGITRRSGNPNGVFLQIRDNANTAVDSSFFVHVYCGR